MEPAYHTQLQWGEDIYSHTHTYMYNTHTHMYIHMRISLIAMPTSHPAHLRLFEWNVLQNKEHGDESTDVDRFRSV